MNGTPDREPVVPPDRARIVVVTAMVGGKDRLRDPETEAPGVDFIAFTDRPIESRRWQVRPCPLWSQAERFTARRNAKFPKILTSLLLPEYDFTIWQDANVTLKVDPRELVRTYFSDPKPLFAAFPHIRRNCVYDESSVVLATGLDDRRLVKAQMAWYRSMGLPARSGLLECRFFIRRRHQRTLALELAWWEQICRFSSRDQLSLPFVLHRLGTPVVPLEGGNAWTNDFYDLHDHVFPDDNPPWIRRVARILRLWVRR
jgi:hypothetical protein